MGNNDVKLIITAQDNTQQAIQSTGKNLDYLGGAMTKLSIQITAFQGAWNAAMAVVQKGMQYINLGAEALRAEEAFSAMTQSVGADAAKMSEDMKRAAGGFVDDSHLMQKAAFAMAQDIDPDKIPQLFEAARLAARLTGQDVGTSIDGMVQAISTNMPRSLRQMGMITKEQMNIFNQAVSAGVTDVNLLDIVLANYTIRTAQLGESQDNAAKQIKRFQVQGEELKEFIGKELIWVLQKLFSVFQLGAAAILAATAAFPKFMEGVSRLSAFVLSATGQDAKAAVVRKDAEMFKNMAADLWGSAGELVDKAGENFTGTSKDTKKGPSAEDAAKAKAKRDRLMADLIKATAALKGADAMQKIREEWASVERNLSADIEKSGLGEFEKKIIDIGKKVEDLEIKASKLPTAAERTNAQKKITKWSDTEINQTFTEELLKDISTEQKAGETRLKNREDLEKRITAVNASELAQRLNSVKEEAIAQQKIADAAYDRSTPEGSQEYQQAIIAIEKAAIEKRKKINAEYYAAVREAQINSELAALDLAEKEGTFHRDTINERIRLIKELIVSEEAHLATMTKTGNEQAWQTQLDKINKYKAALAGLNAELRPVFTALNKYGEEATDVWKNVGTAVTNVFKGMEDALTEFATTGKFNFTDFANSVIKDLVRIMIQKNITGPLASSAGDLLSGLFNSSTPGTNYQIGTPGSALTASEQAYINTGVWHGGGGPGDSPKTYRIVPSETFTNAPRYHGGIGPGEKTAIIRDDESVMTPGQMKALGRMANNSSQQNIKVELVNQSVTPMQSTRSEAKFNGQEYVVTVFLDALNRNAYGLRNALGGA